MLKTANVNAKAFKKTVIIFLILFSATFAGRTAYELIFTGNDILVTYTQNDYGNYGIEYSEKESFKLQSNIATERLNQKDLDGQSILIDQKYEKTANITASSEQFTDDNKKLRDIIDRNNAVIQTENLRGLEGSRLLDMTIGVMPDNFDDFVELIQYIGKMESFNVNKVDKTSEYRELMAQMETLQKSIDSYNEMKQRGGDIKDLLLLEEKILDTQMQMQDLGVNLGSFKSENSYCTINFSMRETSAVIADGSFSVRFALSCVKSAFVWTMFFYIALFALGIGSLFGIWLLLLSYAGIKTMLSQRVDKIPQIEDNEQEKLE